MAMLMFQRGCSRVHVTCNCGGKTMAMLMFQVGCSRVGANCNCGGKTRAMLMFRRACSRVSVIRTVIGKRSRQPADRPTDVTKPIRDQTEAQLMEE